MPRLLMSSSAFRATIAGLSVSAIAGMAVTNLALADTELLGVPATAPSTRPATTPATLPAAGPVATPPTTPAATQPVEPATQAVVDPKMAATVRSLIEFLSHPDWKERKRATDELERLGEPAEPALRAALLDHNLPPNSRTAIEVLLKLSTERRRTGPTLVTLNLSDAEPLKALTAILEQGDLQLTADAKELLASRSATKLNVALDREPLLATLARVGGDAGVGFTGLDDGKVALAPLKSDAGVSGAAGPVATDGPFALCVQRIERTTRRVQDFAAVRGGAANPMANAFSGPPLRLAIAAWGEPRLKPGVWLVEAVSECTTDSGKSLTSQYYGYGRNPKTNDGSTQYLTMSGDADGAKSLSKLVVNARFVLNSSTEMFEIDNCLDANNVTKTIGGVRVVYKGMKKVGDDTWSYEVTIHRDDRTQEDWSTLQQIVDRSGCRIHDAEGKPLQQRGSGSSWGGNELRINGTVGRLNGGGDPKKLTWELPSKFESLSAKFSYKDIPLP